jgi:hypothetical protein
MNEAGRLYLNVTNQVNLRFKRRFVFYIVCDVLLFLASIALGFFDFFSGVVLSVLLLPRIIISVFVACWRTSILPIYTKITFHRESFLKRLATISHHKLLFAWATYSYVCCAIIVLAAIVLGVAHIVVAFGTVGFVAGVISVAAELFMLVVGWWFFASERNVYHYAVTQNVDSLLNSQPELRRAFVIAAAAVHNERVYRQFTQKSDLLLRRRRGGGGGGLGLESQRTTGHNAHDRKDQRQ